MPDANFAIPHFLGGEISQFAQGRFDKPDYRTSLNVCFNSFPNEIGALVRRPATVNASHTRGGADGRVMKFDFEQSNPVTLELTDGRVRFRTGRFLIMTNDGNSISAISSANPAVFTTASANGWASADTVMFLDGPIPVLLQNRQFAMTATGAATFTLADSVTNLPIQGSDFTPVTGAIIGRVHELVTPYTGGSWASVRIVQAGTTAILLNGGVAPQALTVATFPSPVTFAAFALAGAVFNDGPYLDPFINGVQATPSAKTGIIDITLAFPAYSATKAYAIGDFVSSGGVNYRSLVDQNVGSAPPSANWVAASASAAINGGRGFLGSDTGRLVRMLSEPPVWQVGNTYAASTAATPVVAAYNPSGLAGATTYWQSLVGSNTGFAPGSDLTHWQIIPQGAAIWTWGRITKLSNIIDRALAGSAAIGDMIAGGGLAAAFDGVFSQSASTSAEDTVSGSSAAPVTLSSYVGKNYSGAADQAIQQATVYPSSDGGFAFGSNVSLSTITLNLRGNSALPASESDGVLLGTTGPMGNTLSAVTIVSSNQVTAWKYVWIEQITIAVPVASGGLPGPISYSLSNAIAELSFFNPAGTGTSAGVSVEILGPPLLYTNPILTWRLGLFSDTTGWPTCGTYDDGRLWLGGVVKNRFDGSMSNGIVGGTINFAPTDQYGAVAANNAISYTLNAKDTNQILAMIPEESGIIMNTAGGEWLVRAPQTGAIAPNNISARRVTKVGAANIEPVRTEHTNIFVQRYRRKLTEFFPDAYSGKFTGPNLADKALHIVSTGIAEICYTFAAAPTIWGRCDNGALFGVTYKRDTLTTSQPPTFAAFHRHALGSGRTIRSICSGPSVFGNLDTLTMVTRDAATGVHHVELLADTPNEDTTLPGHGYLDDACFPSSSVFVPISDAFPYGGITLNGLWHHNGKTVQVFAGGLDCGDRGRGSQGFTDFVVTNGSLFIPFGDGLSSGPGAGLFNSDFFGSITLTDIIIGFTYNSDGQLVRPIAPADTGARTGPALGLKSRSHQYAMLLSNARGVEIGVTFDKMFPVPLKQANGSDIAALEMFSGVVQNTLNCDYSYESMICWRVSRPFPCNLVAISGKIQTQG